MPDLTNPAQALNRGSQLLSLLGSFWTSLYNDNGTLEAYINAKNQAELQTFRDTLELVACISRFDIPIFHKSNWSVLPLYASQRKTSTLSFGQTPSSYFGNDPISGAVHYYGMPPDILANYPIVDKLKDVSVIVNRIAEPSVSLVKGVDFVIDTHNQLISFIEDPFNNPLNVSYPIFDNNGVQVDSVIQLWMFMADYDWKLLYEQFGYALNIYLESNQNYKDLINVIWDTLTVGSTHLQLSRLLSLYTDNPLIVETTETVQAIYDEGTNKTIVTDKHVYKVAHTATITASVGQSLVAGTCLTDAFKVLYPYNTQIASSDVAMLTLEPNMLQGNFVEGLVFVNGTVATTVTTDSNGRTKITWPLGGNSVDVNNFWDSVQTRGTAVGATSLAKLLDLRYPPVQTTDPTAVNLPTTINPFVFLSNNVLRDNAVIVVLNSSSFGSNALAVNLDSSFRAVIPPGSYMFTIIKIVVGDTVNMDGSGSAISSGYEETLLAGGFVPPDPMAESSPHSYVGTETFSFSTI